MKYVWVIIILSAELIFALTPIHNTFDDKDVIQSEFNNIYENAQDQQFTIVGSTPLLTNIKDGQFVIFSSGAIKVMFKMNQDIFSISASCITIIR